MTETNIAAPYPGLNLILAPDPDAPQTAFLPLKMTSASTLVPAETTQSRPRVVVALVLQSLPLVPVQAATNAAAASQPRADQALTSMNRISA